MNICKLQSVILRLAVGIIALAFLSIASNSLAAQQIMIDGMGDQKEMMQKQFRETLKKHKLATENRIASRIADIDRACELSDQQKKKLSIASKGAIKSIMVAATKQMVETSKQMGFEFDPDEEPKEKDNDDEGRDNAQMAMAVPMPFFGGMSVGNPNDVEKNKVWKSAINKVLTEDQAAKWKTWVDDRNAFQKQVAVNVFIAKVDRRLLLSAEQREKLSEHVDTKFGKQLAKQAAQQDSNQWGMNVNVFFAGAIPGAIQGQVPEDDGKDADPVQSILNETQYEQWSQAFVPQLDQMDGARVMGAMNFIAPAIAVNEWVEEGAEQVEETEDSDDDDK